MCLVLSFLHQMVEAAARMGLSEEQLESLMASFQILHRPQSRRGDGDPIAQHSGGVDVGDASSSTLRNSSGSERRETKRRQLRRKYQAGPDETTSGEEVVRFLCFQATLLTARTVQYCMGSCVMEHCTDRTRRHECQWESAHEQPSHGQPLLSRFTSSLSFLCPWFSSPPRRTS